MTGTDIDSAALARPRIRTLVVVTIVVQVATSVTATSVSMLATRSNESFTVFLLSFAITWLLSAAGYSALLYRTRTKPGRYLATVLTFTLMGALCSRGGLGGLFFDQGLAHPAHPVLAALVCWVAWIFVVLVAAGALGHKIEGQPQQT